MPRWKEEGVATQMNKVWTLFQTKKAQFNSIQFKSLFIRSKDKNTYLMLQVNIKNTLVKFTSYE